MATEEAGAAGGVVASGVAEEVRTALVLLETSKLGEAGAMMGRQCQADKPAVSRAPLLYCDTASMLARQGASVSLAPFTSVWTETDMFATCSSAVFKVADSLGDSVFQDTCLWWPYKSMGSQAAVADAATGTPSLHCNVER